LTENWANRGEQGNSHEERQPCLMSSRDGKKQIQKNETANDYRKETS